MLPPEGVEAGAVTVIVVVFGGLGADTVTVVVTGGVVVCQGVAAARMVRERRKYRQATVRVNMVSMLGMLLVRLLW